MRLTRPLARPCAVTVALATGAQAKFGISKTKVTLKRTRPPEISLLGDTVTVEVTGRGRAASPTGSSTASASAWRTPSPRTRRKPGARGARTAWCASASTSFEARINENVTYETQLREDGRAPGVGRQEEEDRHQGHLRQPPGAGAPCARRAGASAPTSRSTTPSGPRTADASASYQDEFKGDVRIPEQASSEDVSSSSTWWTRAGDHAPPPPSATRSTRWRPCWPWTAISRTATAWPRAASGRKRWPTGWTASRSRATRKRRACTTSAWPTRRWPTRCPSTAPSTARGSRRRRTSTEGAGPGSAARSTSRSRSSASRRACEYAADAQRYTDETRKWREARDKRGAAAPPRAGRKAEAEAPPRGRPRRRRRRPAAPAAKPRRSAGAAQATPAPPAPKAPANVPAQDGLASSAGLAVPLRNGSFESGLDPWTVAGQGRGRSGAEARAASSRPASMPPPPRSKQPIGVDVENAPRRPR